MDKVRSPVFARRASRRALLAQASRVGAASLLSPVALPAAAREARSRPPAELRGRTIDLVVSEAPVNLTGRTRPATLINGSLPAPTLRWTEGETVRIRVTNRLSEPTSIHWHGLILPFEMDGVPGISFPGIAPGETFTYRFRIQQAGTYWYHSHSAFQEQTGMYGAIVIDPPSGPSGLREHVVVLSDWTDLSPAGVYKRLKTDSGLYNFIRPTTPQLIAEAARDGVAAALTRREMWNRMRMSPTDLSDLSSAVLTYLCNGLPPEANWTGTFAPGERVRLRFVNAAANTFYDVRVPDLPLTVVQTDGVDVEPVTVDEFRFGPGETYDVIVEPRRDAYTIFAQAMDRTGFARGTLAAAPGLAAPVPAVDPPRWLTMADMVGAAGMSGMSGMSGMGTASGEHAHEMPPPAEATPVRARHAASEYGPSTDNRVDVPRVALDDPGPGLRDNGRRVLTLADLHSRTPLPDERDPGREIELHLTGNMERYAWSFDGLEFGRSTPVHFRHGERLRVVLHNDTMMTHPMHLHGMWSDVETPAGEAAFRRHTVPVQPGQRVAFRVTADALGRWAWHCHLLFHMDAGMFREVVVS